MTDTTPNICSNIILDYRVAPESKSTLENLGYNVVLTQKIDSLYEAVNGHSDMQIFVSDGKIIAANEVYNYYRKIFGNDVICGSQKLSGKYPYDIPYNAACVGDFIICNKDYAAKKIIELALQTQKTILDVKQGYSKCSVGIIGKNAIATADAGIAEKCMSVGIDVLQIEPGYIELSGMNYGFIGGTCGMINENTIAFNGELKTHPQGEEIFAFCKKHNIGVIELKKGPLVDIGSIITL